MCGFSCKKKERKVLNSSLYSLTHRNARILKLVSLRVRRIRYSLFSIKVFRDLQLHAELFLRQRQ